MPMAKIRTNKPNGFREESGQVLAPVVGDGDLHVLDSPAVFEHIRQISSHVQHVLQTTTHFPQQTKITRLRESSFCCWVFSSWKIELKIKLCAFSLDLLGPYSFLVSQARKQ